MATLQNIRSKGPLLVIVIGLALFAFIAGDAWKVLQPHQAHDVGEVNGDALSAQDYQASGRRIYRRDQALPRSDCAERRADQSGARRSMAYLRK